MIIFTEMNRNNDYYLNNEKIIHLVIKYRNFILYDYNDYYYFEYIKFKDYYIKYSYYYEKLYRIEYYNYSSQWHKEDSPAYINYDQNGKILKKAYYLNGKEYSRIIF